jgi:hypothetical protein
MATEIKNTSLSNFIDKLLVTPESVDFTDVIEIVNKHYRYNPASFINGTLQNEAGTNEGSCKIFYFAQIHKLTEQQTLNCFGHYYRDDVLKNPCGDDHGNIRNFIKTGWQQLTFDTVALTPLL